MQSMRSLCLVILLAFPIGCSKEPTASTATPHPRPATAPSALATRPAFSEQQRVEYLIASIRTLKDATFIRNGQEHGGQAAAALLQYRWNRDKEQLKTAEEFIRKAATQSSTTGQPYLIRFSDGTQVRSEHYLRKKLEELAK